MCVAIVYAFNTLQINISREGKIDVLRELCLDSKNNHYIVEALKTHDKFGQTPMLSSINAAENR